MRTSEYFVGVLVLGGLLALGALYAILGLVLLAIAFSPG
jgi:hypothetical protein